MTLTKTSPAYVGKLRRLAAACTKAAEEKLRDRNTNTPKRQKEAASAAIDGRHLERTAALMNAFADAIEADKDTTGLPVMSWASMAQVLKTKDDFMRITRKRVDTSGGYYSIRELDEYTDQTPTGQSIRLWLERQETPEQRAAAVAAKARQEILDAEARLRFSAIPGFFPTPPAIVQQLLNLAAVCDGHEVLEPSAGKGDILEAVRERRPTAHVYFVEQNLMLAALCAKKGFQTAVGCPDSGDFLEYAPGLLFDRIIGNPPFERRQDATHVMHAYNHLRPDGRLVMIVSAGTLSASDAKSTKFREWLTEVDSEIVEPDGDFKTAFNPTGAQCKIVVINR